VAFISNDEAAEVVDPCEGSFDHLSVLSQLLSAVDAAPRNARNHTSFAQVTPAAVEVVSLAGMQLDWSLAWSNASVAQGMNGIDYLR